MHLLPPPSLSVLHHTGHLHVEAAGSGLSAMGLMQTLSPGVPLPPMMPSTPPSSSSPPGLLPPCTNGNNGIGKMKAGSRGGIKKHHSPICGGAGIVSKMASQQCMLVAGEPVTLTDTGTHTHTQARFHLGFSPCNVDFLLVRGGA